MIWCSPCLLAFCRLMGHRKVGRFNLKKYVQLSPGKLCFKNTEKKTLNMDVTGWKEQHLLVDHVNVSKPQWHETTWTYKVSKLSLETKFPFERPVMFPSVPGHEGCLVFGTIEGTPCVFMKGHFHLYEGYSLCQVSRLHTSRTMI